MKYSCFVILSFSFLLSCSQEISKTLSYPQLDNNRTTIEEFGIKYNNDYSNLEDIKKEVNQNWLLKQDSIVADYYKSVDRKGAAKHLNDLHLGDYYEPYWYKSYKEHSFHWLDNDSTQILFKSDSSGKGEIPVFSTSMDNTVHFYSPHPDGSKFILFISDENGDFLKVISTESGNILFETDKDMNMEQASWAVWASSEHIAFTGWPNQEGSRDSYIAMANIRTGAIKVIFDGSQVKDYDHEDFLRPDISVGSNKLQVFVITASEHFTGYSADISNIESDYVWEHIYDQKDSILYWPKQRDTSMYFLRYNGGKKTLVRSTLKSMGDPTKDVVLYRPEIEDVVITDYAISENNVYVITSRNGTDETLYYVDNQGKSEIIDLDYPISDIQFYHTSTTSNEITVTKNDWKYDLSFLSINDSLEIKPLDNLTRQTPDSFNDIITEIIEVESHDGTMVPMTIIRNRENKQDSKGKGVVYAYGAYGFSVEPFYDISILDFVSKGNVFAVAHVRGGAEKGLKWYKDGIKEKKFNSWKDLLWCSQYLKDQGYVDKDRLGVWCSSAGGITAGMAVNENPDMFKAFVGAVPTLNPLRLGYQKNFDASNHEYDFGNLKTIEGFKSLMALDPVVNFKKNTVYPSTLMMSGALDEQIPLYNTAKYIALLQNYCPDPKRTYLLDVYEDEGHYVPNEGFSAMLFFDKEL
ncbi:prolyl oligopeptidase family serine peptidase [Maribacter polysaccharolyticus]|uniref:prolyl oligopeptidase family serine peptidase n=1 Tax=Maribacter polysaccharolyticus TaxID=3020831 RepID=UPI00237F062D|nr:prolyl oligopeptidase family serine peptidase [Maribacter polysaccharolyticus]MDE3744015.1 prolyl oligopeptidase family serine peptidase [Maribacter polysaccharolyticus]